MSDQPAFRAADPQAGLHPAGPSFALGNALPAALLYRRCDPAELPFELCSELEEAPGLIGQERAVEALNFAVRMRAKGYNVYALGRAAPAGTAWSKICCDIGRKRSRHRPTGVMSTILTTRSGPARCGFWRVRAPGSRPR